MVSIKLIPCSPVHIGYGETGMLGYEFVVKEQSAYRIDINKVVEKIQNDEREINALVEEMLNPRNFAMADYLSKRGIKPEDVSSYKIPSFVETAKNTYTVHFFLKDPLNQVYIPGSTIKGAIKTQYGAKNVSIDQVTKHDCNKLVTEQWDSFFTSKGRSRHPLIRDSARVDASSALVLCPFEIHTERRGEIYTQQQKIYAEVIGIGKEFQTEVTGADENKLKPLFQAASEHARKLAEFEYKFFEKHGRKEEYKNVIEFYNKLKNGGEGGYLLRIGSGSSFLSTAILSVLAFEGDPSWKEAFKEVLPRRRSREAQTIPDSRKLVRYNNKLYPPGWLEIRLGD